MRTKLKTVKAPKVLRERVDFEEWKARLAGLLRRGSRELNALEQWIQYHSAYFAQIGSPDLTDTGTLLETVFECTQPEVFSKVELSRYQSAAKQLNELLPRIEATIGALKSTNSCLVPKDGMPGRRYSNLQRSLETTASQIRWALLLTERPYMRSADVISHCIVFLASLDYCNVTESDALALTSLLMKAHGFNDEELTAFGAGAIDSGRFRKRIKAYIKANSDIKKAQQEFLEAQRNRTTGEIQALSQELANLMKNYTPKSV